MNVVIEQNGIPREYGVTRLPPIPIRSSHSMSHSDKLQQQLESGFVDEDVLFSLEESKDSRDIRTIELHIDTRRCTVVDVGTKLPELRHLKLKHSFVHAIRDLGSSLNNLRILCMPHCHLQTLDGLSSMPCVTELYLAYNEIVDTSPCALLDRLEILDLEGNKIDGKDNIMNLRVCERLSTLSLSGNPVVETLGGIKSYRKSVRKILVSLKILDDESVKDSKPKMASSFDPTHFDYEWKYIDEVLRELGLVSCKRVPDENSPSSKTPCPPIDAHGILPPGRSGNEFSLKTANGQRNAWQTSPTTSLSSLKSSSTHHSRRSSTSSLSVNTSDMQEGTSSDLTTGHVVCGGISKALRSRRQSNQLINPDGQKSANPSKNTSKSALQLFKEKFRSKHCSSAFSNDVINDHPDLRHNDSLYESIIQQENELKVQCKEVLEELSTWRKNNTKNLKLFHPKNKDLSHVERFEAGGDLRLISPSSDCTIEDRSLSRLNDEATANELGIVPELQSNENGDGPEDLCQEKPTGISDNSEHSLQVIDSGIDQRRCPENASSGRLESTPHLPKIVHPHAKNDIPRRRSSSRNRAQSKPANSAKVAGIEKTPLTSKVTHTGSKNKSKDVFNPEQRANHAIPPKPKTVLD